MVLGTPVSVIGAQVQFLDATCSDSSKVFLGMLAFPIQDGIAIFQLIEQLSKEGCDLL